ncbi:HAMP domain-containing histidine kinase [bacterium]|jgi:signal transduction histidine kinase|nr:HAMP domain-containing histidine kinase [bacterium]MDA9327776.1 HAMP domain-containing histidine kinase [Flavobacteriaceae bacterium]MDB9927481.1 HAMP domain-containing histidine kinase [Flavobacteriaceae bacterium]MDB9955708.1 HAMP domain-containing histidine kinase [Flavobacteriaceae bacterium]MDC1343286.1 HAMP domain-containing histidine kinase [Flavobacteriaceae bacterium]|tara:strand:- start:1688 stop:2848 length:1161 start_codon:yes stop_codon:yes gene_type:complete
MSFLKDTLLLKRIVITISFSIVTLILWNTYSFFKRFKNEERLKMEIVATAMKEFATNQDLEADVSLEDKIIKSNTNIPMILVDENGNIGANSYLNLDPVKAKDPAFLLKQLEIMKEQNSPIEINFAKNRTQYIYYRNSDLLNKLSYYPLALILILTLFLTVIYMMFTSSKVAEQNKLWTGMAKETAHQIGTPLSSLLGWIAILKMENADDKYVDEIEKDVHRLNTIANRFSKIGSLPTLKKLDIIAVTKNAYEYLEYRSSKQISFSFNTSETNLYSTINDELYSWVIENLIKNAIDAMLGKGELAVAITADAKKIKIDITDTGKGMAKSQFKKIFKPGFTTKKRGWGLGLSLSKRIIEDYHKGKIVVKNSEINKGTTFQIVLDKIS